MISRNIKAVIFDFDGVIVDTEEVGVRVSCDIMKKKCGVDLTGDDKRRFYGLQDLSFYQYLAQKYAFPSSPEELLLHHNEMYGKEILSINDCLPGVRNLLNRLQAQRIPTAICSGSYRHQIVTILNNLALDSFDLITSCEETSKHKPHPEPYLLTAEKLRLKPVNCLAIEDSENGIISARSAGMYCVGVSVGNHGTQDLRRANLVVPSLDLLDPHWMGL